MLKDASSTAIYGSRGSNGVIIVTTKRGGNPTDDQTVDHAQGRHRILAAAPQARRDERHGIRTLPQRLRLLQHPSSYEDIGEGTAPSRNIPSTTPISLGKGTDWIDEITRTAPYQNYNALDFGPLEKEQLLRLAGLQRYRRASSTTAVCSASRRASESRPPAVQMAEGRLPRQLHMARQRPEPGQNRRHGLVERAAMYLSPHTRPAGQLQPALRQRARRINNAALRRSTRTPTPSSGPRSTNTAYRRSGAGQGPETAAARILLLLRTSATPTATIRASLPAKNEGEGGRGLPRRIRRHSALSSENTVSYKLETKSGPQHRRRWPVSPPTAIKTRQLRRSSGQGYMDDDVHVEQHERRDRQGDLFGTPRG